LIAHAALSGDALVERFRFIQDTRMAGLPFLNQALTVEAVGFREYGEHQLGVLITPWFMNLVIMPGAGKGSRLTAGSKTTVRLPCGPVEFTVASDETLGNFLSAVLFGSVSEIDDQATAREIAQQVMRELFQSTHGERRLSRRALFAHVEAADA
jgi:[NiFe] hydrogenase assembly HybE family chaperone